ncbi:MAG TPA: DNA mismatch repair protein MutL, partial [Chthoniobacterales bacterium]
VPDRRWPVPETDPLLPSAEQFSLRRDWADLPAAGAPAPDQPDPPPPVPPGKEWREGSEAPVGKPLDSGPVRQPSSGPDSNTAASANESTGLQAPRILGVLGRLYVLMENEAGLVLLDQHAAHERILFERLRSQMEREGVPGQRLLLPITVQVAPKDYDWIHCNLDTLVRMGFALEPFGEGTLKIDAVPPFLQAGDPAGTVRHLVDELRSVTTATSRLRLGEDVIAKTVCRHAVKANDVLRGPEIEQLIRDLLACELPYCCPHGRPTMVQISFLELEKKFGRKK